MDRYGRSVSAYPILQGGDFSYEQQESFHRVKQWLLNQDEYVACPPPSEEPLAHAYYRREENYVDDYLPSRYCSDSQLNHYIASSASDHSNFRKLEARRYYSPNLTRRRPNGSRESNINKIYASTPDALDKLTENEKIVDNYSENYASKINTFPRRHKSEKQHQPIPNSLLQQQTNMGQQLEKYQPFSCSENVLQNTHTVASPERKTKIESKYKVRLLRPKSWSEVKSSVFNHSQIEGNYHKHKDFNENNNDINLPDVTMTTGKSSNTPHKKRPHNEPLHIRMSSAPETHSQTAKLFPDEYRKRVPSLIRKVKAFSWPKRAVIQSYSTVSLAKDADHPLNKTESGYNTEKSEEKQSDEKDVIKTANSECSSEMSDTPPARPPLPQPKSLKKTLSNRISNNNTQIERNVRENLINSPNEYPCAEKIPVDDDAIEKIENIESRDEFRNSTSAVDQLNENASVSTDSSAFENVDMKEEFLSKDTKYDEFSNELSPNMGRTTPNLDKTFDNVLNKQEQNDNGEPKCRVSINLQVRNKVPDSLNTKPELEKSDEIPVEDIYDVIDINDSKELLDDKIDGKSVSDIVELRNDNLTASLPKDLTSAGNDIELENSNSKILHCKSASEDATLSLIQEKDCSDLSRSASISLRDLIRIHEQEIARVAGRPKLDYSSTEVKRKSCIIESKSKIESPSHWKRHTTIGLVSEHDFNEITVNEMGQEPNVELTELQYGVQEEHHAPAEVELRSPKSFASSVTWPQSPTIHTSQFKVKPQTLNYPQPEISEWSSKITSPKSFFSQKSVSLRDAYIQTDYVEHIDEETLLRREENYQHEIDFYQEQVMFLTSENERLKEEFASERTEMHRKLDEQRKVANAYQKLEDRYRRKVYELQKRLHRCTCAKNINRNLANGDDGWTSRTLSPYSDNRSRRDHEISVEKVNGILHQLEAWLNNQTNGNIVTDTSEVSSLFESVCDDHNYARYRLVDHYASPPLEIIEQIDATSV